MLDGGDSAERGAAHPFLADGMGGHGAARRLRGLDDELDLVNRKSWLRFAGRTPGSIGINLNPVRAMADLIANDSD